MCGCNKPVIVQGSSAPLEPAQPAPQAPQPAPEPVSTSRR